MTDDPEYPVRTSVVPHIYPIESPESAVRVAILEGTKDVAKPGTELDIRELKSRKGEMQGRE